MNIFLIGYRGSGKTTLGRLLADQLWKSFVDLDEEIRKRFDNLTIAKIWETHGEPAFRTTEAELAQHFSHQDDQVIALGGGTLMHPAARKSIESAPHAIRIYLACDPAILHQRISSDPLSADTRPDLTDQGGLKEITAVLAERDPVYRAVADKIFDVTHVTPKDAVAHLIKRCL